MKSEIIVREYRQEDVQSLANIYYHTIHQINIRDYSEEQVDAWAPPTSLEAGRWSKKFLKTKPLVAVAEGVVVGFAEFEPDGHIDCFYCHHEWIGKGVGSALMNVIRGKAHRQNLARIFAEVSITAKPFFEKQGFITKLEQTVVIDGVQLTNFKMEKILK